MIKNSAPNNSATRIVRIFQKNGYQNKTETRFKYHRPATQVVHRALL